MRLSPPRSPPCASSRSSIVANPIECLSPQLRPGRSVRTRRTWSSSTLFSNLGWINKYQSMIIPDISFTLPLAIWILTSFIAEMPWELKQAAKIDGCTPGKAFRLVILPRTAPGVFTTVILVFIYAWNGRPRCDQLQRGSQDKPGQVIGKPFP
jgi:Binding-protein-dependent transport system inner membrane component